MPEQFDDRRPESLLPGSGRPRPLSPAMRARLEQSLLSVVGSGEPGARASAPPPTPLPAGAPAPAPKPLSPEVRDRLESRLRRPRRPRRPRPEGNWKRIVPGAAVAAAIAVLAAIVVPQLVNSPSKPGGTFAAKAAVPGSAAPGRAAPDQSAPAATGTTVTGHPAAVPGPVAAVMEPPVVSSVSPRRGPTAGGNWVVVVGRGFDGISAVDFGASSAVRFIVESPVRLKVSAPAHGAGTVDVVVVGATGRSSISVLDRYRFGP